MIVDQTGIENHAKSDKIKGKWQYFGLKPEEKIIGVYGETYTEFQRLKTFGFIL